MVVNLLFVLAVFILPSGCSDRELSRSKAEAILKKSVYFTHTMPENTVDLDVPEVMPVRWVKVLEEKGYIKIGQQLNPFLAQVSLTPKGQAESKSWYFRKSPDRWIIPLAEFVDITGIRQEGTQAVVQNRYRLKLTKYGEEIKQAISMNLSTEVRTAEITLVRYDDGWRVH